MGDLLIYHSRAFYLGQGQAAEQGYFMMFLNKSVDKGGPWDEKEFDNHFFASYDRCFDFFVNIVPNR